MQKKCSSAIVAILIIATGMMPWYAAQAEETKDEVLISDGATTITRTDFEADMQRIPETDRFEFRSSLDRLNRMIEGLYLNRALANKARAAALDQDPLVQHRLQIVADGILANAWLTDLEAKAVVPDFEGRARELYLAEPEKYTTPPMVRASHILVSTKKRPPEEALKRVEEARERALKGESFASLALEYSDDPGADRSKGDLGFFEASKMQPSFAEAAFALKQQGEISPPVLTKFGYHIIMLQDKKDSALKSFDEVKDKLIKRLKEDYLDQLREDERKSLRNSEKKKVDADAIARLKTVLPTIPRAVKPDVK